MVSIITQSHGLHRVSIGPLWQRRLVFWALKAKALHLALFHRLFWLKDTREHEANGQRTQAKRLKDAYHWFRFAFLFVVSIADLHASFSHVTHKLTETWQNVT